MRPRDYIKPRVANAPLEEEEAVAYEPLNVIHAAGPQAMLRRPKEFIEEEFGEVTSQFSPMYTSATSLSIY